MYSITILGAYGAKSAKGGSSAFYLDDKNVIDAGNILKTLKEKNAQIETIWLTHSHLDHIVDIAYILDNYYEKRTKTLKICGLKETLEIVQRHFFNHKIWPDFSQIPLKNNQGMTLEFQAISLGKSYTLENQCRIEAFKTDHTVPSCGYIFTQKEKSILISADTYNLASVVESVKNKKGIKSMVIECSFPTSMKQLAIDSKHLTPELLFEGLAPLEDREIILYINHMKPAYEEKIAEEIAKRKGKWSVEMLKDGDIIYF